MGSGAPPAATMTRPSPSSTRREAPGPAVLKKRTHADGSAPARGGKHKKKAHAGGGKAAPSDAAAGPSPAAIAAAARAGIEGAAAEAAKKKINLIEVRGGSVDASGGMAPPHVRRRLAFFLRPADLSSPTHPPPRPLPRRL